MESAIIICTRLSSNRIPRKALLKINGREILHHLIENLKPCGLPVILAYPENEKYEYGEFLIRMNKNGYNVRGYAGYDLDPMKRMYHAAKTYGVKNVVRVTHDKIFVNTDLINRFVDIKERNNIDYVYSSTQTDGTRFEVIDIKALEKAVEKYENIEHISYAIKKVTTNFMDINGIHMRKNVRLLIDFPEDIQLMEILFACLGNDAKLNDVLNFMDENNWVNVNKLPKITLYTCAYNAEKWITECMESVVKQFGFAEYEYLLIDDHSTDKTPYKMAQFSAAYPNIHYIRNQQNLGLASSSNIALKKAKGEYIIRMDADDYFVGLGTLQNIYSTARKQDVDVIYPNNYYGDFGTIQYGDECHHVGGALFKTRAINHLKFTDGLRNYDGYDLFKRAKEFLRIGYYHEPAFFYRQHDDSMSKTNLKERERTKRMIDEGLTW